MDTLNATFLQALAAGPMRSDSPDGMKDGNAGPPAYPVSRFRARENDRERPMSDTYGPLFTHSSPSANLQSSLESRLRQSLGESGSPLYALTWRHWDMPAGERICALRASARPISGSAFFGWRTPTAHIATGMPPETTLRKIEEGHSRNVQLEDQVRLAGWPTPNALTNNDTDSKWQERREKLRLKYGNNGFGLNLSMAAQLVGWATPRKSANSPDYGKENTAKLEDQSFAILTGWDTPTAADTHGHKYTLDGKTKKRRLTKTGLIGENPFLCHVQMANGVRFRLNPNFSRWLMGFPHQWTSTAPPKEKPNHTG